MAGDPLRQVTFAVTKLFEKTFSEFVGSSPKIRNRLKEFKELKTTRPPGRFDDEHQLHGKLSDYRECHLDGDVCLLFVDKKDTVTLLAVCNHADLRGPRAKSLARKIKNSIK